MNICYLSKEYPPNIIGGVGIYTQEISRSLSQLGHKIFVITEAKDKEGTFHENGVCVMRVRPARLPVFFFLRDRIKMTVERLEYSYAVSRRLRQLMKDERIDVVESCEARAEGFWHYLFASHPPLLVKLHTPESIIFRWNRDDAESLDFKLMEKLEEYWIFKAKRLVAITRSMRGLASNYYQFDLGNLPVIPNPFNINVFKPGLPEKTADAAATVLYAGRLEFRKGVHVLIRAVPLVLKEFPDTKFVFVGSDCGMKLYLQKKVEEFKCGANVSFVDHVPREKLVEFYHNSTVCVMPSLWENYPYACLEAMACGKPVVASRVGGLAEIIDDNKDGVLFAPGSVLELARGITRLLKDRKFAEAVARNAARKIKERYSSTEVTRQTLASYQTLVK
jgi:glycogen(starch) synthase